MPNSRPRTWAALVAVAFAAQPIIASAAPEPGAPNTAVVREAEQQVEFIEKNRTLIEELTGMGATDQMARNRWVDLYKDADAPTRMALTQVWSRHIAPIDAAHEARIRQLLAARSEWFRISEVGRDAAKAAFLIVQHAGDLGLQKAALAKMEPLLASDDINKSDYALLWDRVAIREGRPQRYGTQGTACDNGKFVVPRDVEDPAGLDARRAAVGLPPMSVYLDVLNKTYGRCEAPPAARDRKASS
jgi:hypothetical protein